MKMNHPIRLAAIGTAVFALASSASNAMSQAVRGTVTDASGRPLRGALVTARDTALGLAVTVFTDSTGAYRIIEPPSRPFRLEASKLGFGSEARFVEETYGEEAAADFTLAIETTVGSVPSSMYLGLLPDGQRKRRFILDCTGCHQFDARTISGETGLKSREAWEKSVDLMLSFAGAETSFPVMSPRREAGPTASWLVENLGSLTDGHLEMQASRYLGSTIGEAVIVEYDFPIAQDLPHDLAVAPDDRILVTGMFTHQIHALDPETATFSAEAIPVQGANPRAIEIDGSGDWWVLLGAPQQMARYDVSAGGWETYPLGMYPHSIAIDGESRIWFNGHFTKDPELIGYLKPGEGTTTFEVPVEPMIDGGSSIPYGMRVGPDGTIWATQLLGNHLVRFDPAAREFRLYELPTGDSGPRRLDVGPDGIVWIPEYAGNKLARFDPETETFKEYEFPIPDGLPYVVRVDARRGTVWIGTSAADAVASFDPADESFTVYPLPTRGALTRHIDIDEKTGAVWGAYSPAPAIAPKVFKLMAR